MVGVLRKNFRTKSGLELRGRSPPGRRRRGSAHAAVSQRLRHCSCASQDSLDPRFVSAARTLSVLSERERDERA
eukprot:754546-Prymnesium_polylepis.1